VGVVATICGWSSAPATSHHRTRPIRFVKSGWAGTRPHGPELDGVLSIAGAAFARSRWGYFALIVNWPAAAGSLPEVEPSFFAATNAIFTLVRDRLGT